MTTFSPEVNEIRRQIDLITIVNEVNKRTVVCVRLGKRQQRALSEQFPGKLIGSIDKVPVLYLEDEDHLSMVFRKTNFS